jgi:hypothetical protein
MKLSLLCQALDGEQVTSVGLGGEHAARVDGIAIQDDTAATAIAGATNELGAFKMMSVECFQQGITGMDTPLQSASIYLQRNV